MNHKLLALALGFGLLSGVLAPGNWQAGAIVACALWLIYYGARR